MNKKPYQAPRLSRFGRIDEITRGVGVGVFTDTIFNGDGTIRGVKDGADSVDGVVVPCGEQPPQYECG